MKTSFSNPLLIAAGGTSAIEATGDNFYVISSPVEIEIRAGEGAPKTYKQGQGERMANGETFHRLEVTNKSGGAIWVKVWAGYGQFVDNTRLVADGYTEAVGQNISTLAAGASLDLTGIPWGSYSQRKSIVVSNLDPAALIYCKDWAGNVLLPVFPQTSITLPISGFVKVANDNGAAVPCHVSEIWYKAF